MKASVVEGLISEKIPGRVTVTTRDEVHFEAMIVSPAFEGLSRLKRQQMVYEALGKALLEGHVHAISLKTLTPAEAQTKQ